MPRISPELPTLRYNQRWYVRVPGRTEVQEVRVIETTPLTVLLELKGDDTMASFGLKEATVDRRRYVTSEVRWIEQLAATA